MDPTENYRKQLSLALKIQSAEECGDWDLEAQGNAAELVELVLALHDWLGNGGFQPKRFEP